MGFSLSASIPVSKVRREYLQCGRAQIQPFLDRPSAEALCEHLLERPDWQLVLNAGEKVFEIERSAFATMDAAAREKLETMVLERARDSFQFRFESIRVADAREQRRASSSLLDEFAEFMCSDEVLALFREITGETSISFADAQATSYGPGDFLTQHDDDVSGKNRRAAYVLGLTQNWRAEWGGLLMFHDTGGDVMRALLPRFNCLNVFAVPQLHSVSFVTPLAPKPRYSVTGWLRVIAL